MAQAIERLTGGEKFDGFDDVEAEDYIPREVIGNHVELRYGGSVVLLIPGEIDHPSIEYWGCDDNGEGVVVARLRHAHHIMMRHVANVQFDRMREVDDAVARGCVYIADSSAAIFNSDDGQRMVIRADCSKFGLWRLEAIEVGLVVID